MQNPLSEKIYKKRKIDRKSDIRGDYFRDQTAIIHSTAFRRLKNKTQVFFAPENDHICTRIEHVMHVATIARVICTGLNKYSWELDPDLAYAIGLGHDLGHTPFGHTGEYALNKKLKGKINFMHEINSYRQVEYIANNGKGLNLTYAVKDGIISHNGETDEQYLKPKNSPNDLDKIKNRKVKPTSYEACIMRFSDKLAYLGRDIEDALVAKFIKEKDIPNDVKKFLGNKNGQIINSLVIDIIENSKNKDSIGFSDEKYELVTKLKKFNYKHIYHHEQLIKYHKFCFKIINELFDYLHEIYEKNKNDYQKYLESDIKLDVFFGEYLKSMEEFYANNTQSETIITDYIAGMTDVFAIKSMKQISIPEPIPFY